MRRLFSVCTLFVGLTVILDCDPGVSSEPETDYYQSGELAGSLKTKGPLPVYHSDSHHLWNRLFSALYIRTGNVPSELGGEPIQRTEGGDYIDFLAWGKTEHWSSIATSTRLNHLLEEFANEGGSDSIDNPLKKVVLLRDLWAAYDHLVEQNMRRFGDLETRRRRDRICQQLARTIQSLALPLKSIRDLPDTYMAAVGSGYFAARQDFVSNNNYLPHELLTDPEQWVEIDFYQPDLHADLYDRFLTLHARAYRGRSYFRIFYRHPEGRASLIDYLQRLKEEGVDWRQAAQEGFIRLTRDAPQIPVGFEVALLQFMITLDENLLPTATKIVESVRHRTYRNVDGSAEPETNTGLGMHVMEYTLKRRLLFDNLSFGGLHREPDQMALYRVIFQPKDAPDWGTQKRKVLFQQCADCHMGPRVRRTGVHSLPSIVHMGGFDVGAQLGIVHALDPQHETTRGQRVTRWKSQHATYVRLLEHLER